MRLRELRQNQTPAEQALWEIVRRKNIYGLKFRRQHPFPPYIADFYCQQANLVIELDGGQHATGEAVRYDEKRTQFLQSQGLTVLRFWNTDILDNLEGVFETIMIHLDSLSLLGQTPSPHPSPRGRGGRKHALIGSIPLPLGEVDAKPSGEGGSQTTTLTSLSISTAIPLDSLSPALSHRERGHNSAAASQGSVVMLTLAFLLAMTLQVLLLGTVVNRTLGTSAVSSTQSVAAKEAADTGLERLHQTLIAYIKTTPPVAATILTTYGTGGPLALSNVPITVTNPETNATSTTPVTFSAYVAQARGTMFELVSTATYRDVQMTSRKWVLLDQCQFATSSTPTALITNPGSAYGMVFTDDMNNRAIISDTDTRTLLYRDNTLLTTLLGERAIKFFADKVTGRIFFENSTGDTIYQLNTDNSLVSIPSMAPGSLYHGNLVVNRTTGELFTYRHPATATERGLWKYNPDTTTATQLTTMDLDTNYYPNLRMNPNDGRIFIVNDWGNDYVRRPAYTWAQATGLTTLPSVSLGIFSFALNTNDGRIFFGDGYFPGSYNSANLYTWAPATGLSTLIAGCNRSVNGTAIDITRNRMYATCNTNSNSSTLYSWDATNGLSTIASGLPISESFNRYALLDGVSGTYFTANNNSGQILQYNPANGSLTTLPMGSLSENNGPRVMPFNAHPLLNAGFSPSSHRNNNRGHYNVYYTDNSIPSVSGGAGAFIGGDDALYYWTPTNGITTLLSLPGGKPGGFMGDITVDPATGNAFIGSDTANGYFYTASSGRLISLAASGGLNLPDYYGPAQGDAGHYNNVNFKTGRVYFFKGAAAGSLNTVYSASVSQATCD
jgi:very-short-patch-repair endonuclease